MANGLIVQAISPRKYVLPDMRIKCRCSSIFQQQEFSLQHIMNASIYIFINTA